MLSQAVKIRRRINRVRKQQPAWRTCMQALYQHKLTMLKMQRNSVFGASTSGALDTNIMPNLNESWRIKQHMKTITRQEFREELVTKHHSRHAQDLRGWAEIIARGEVSRFLDDLKRAKKGKKYWSVTREQLRRRKVVKAQFANSLKNQ